MTKTAAVFLATGTEEMEFTIIYDVLVRAGVKVTSVFVPSQDEQASPKDGYVVASRGVKLVPDTTLDACLQGAGLQSFDALIVPGGAGGASTMSQHAKLREALKAGEQQGQLLGLICAGPLAALESQVGLGGPITSHPSVKEKLSSSYQYEEKPVVTVNNLVTSRGPGTTFAFALTLVEKLVDAQTRDTLASQMVLAQEHL